MRYAYPRQREAHLIKSKLLPPGVQNHSYELLHLKKEEMRILEQQEGIRQKILDTNGILIDSM